MSKDNLDTMEIEILDDGSIVVKTEGISSRNHMSADEFVSDVSRLSGGATSKEKRKEHKHTHTHKTRLKQRS